MGREGLFRGYADGFRRVMDLDGVEDIGRTMVMICYGFSCSSTKTGVRNMPFQSMDFENMKSTIAIRLALVTVLSCLLRFL
jgi:hypothetical protein